MNSRGYELRRDNFFNDGCYNTSQLKVTTLIGEYYKQSKRNINCMLFHFRRTLLTENEDYKKNYRGDIIYFQSSLDKINNYLREKIDKKKVKN